MDIRARIFGAAVAAGLMLAGTSASAVTQTGGEFTVSVVQNDTDTATFTYTADFTNWAGPGDYIFAIDFGLSEPKVATIDSFSTTATGGWVEGLGPTNANGCGDVTGTFACAVDTNFDPATGQTTDGVVTWTFRITFDSNLTSANWTDSDNHIGAFFYQSCGDQNGCQSTNGLSQETTFGDDSGGDDSGGDDVPEPGTLALLGIGLLGLGAMRRRKAN